MKTVSFLIDHGLLSLPTCDVTLPAQFSLVRHRSNVLTLVHSQANQCCTRRELEVSLAP